MLRIEGLTAGYGFGPVLRDVSLDVAEGERLVIAGRNASGKSTLIKSIVGLLPEVTGQMELDGKSLLGLPAHRRARRGVAYVPQGRGIFPELSVRENLEIGTRAGTSGTIPAEVFDYFPILRDRIDQPGGTMSGGEQQQLAIARALCGRPRLLLMDEPSDGIQPSVLEMLGALIPRIVAERRLALILVEQNLDFALSIAGRCIVMDRGEVIHRGATEDLANPETAARFLAI
ncbi:ABC transporter ATP-binding protein [Pseudooceanicola sp. C21-150M6]|uniref:ABC transporter ATP-binding protein n=1 Tax=Pseudooceanicola sp. C21-150M6 TaxID=3434355 RepID=UPI003D7FFF23